MRSVVTGSSGHIGGAIARHLHHQGHEVIGISRSRSNSLPDTVQQLCLDIAVPDFIQRACELAGDCDAVVHAAACLETDPTCMEISRVNCLGTQQVAFFAGQIGAKHLIHISGLNVLGLPCEHPVTESHPVAPADLYAASKLYSEHIIALTAETILKAVSLRVSSPVGPGLKRRRITRIFIEQALQGRPITVDGAGSRLQDYVDVRDVARVVEAAIRSEEAVGGIYNVASGRPVSNLELARLCVQVLGSESEIVFSGRDDPNDSVSWDVSIKKAVEVFGYAPQYPLRVSIADMAADARQEK